MFLLKSKFLWFLLLKLWSVWDQTYSPRINKYKTRPNDFLKTKQNCFQIWSKDKECGPWKKRNRKSQLCNFHGVLSKPFSKQSSKDRRCDCRRAVCWGWGLHENLREGVLQGCIIEQWQLMILVRPACKKPTSSCGIFSIFPLLPAYLRAFLHISHDFRVQRKAKVSLHSGGKKQVI